MYGWVSVRGVRVAGHFLPGSVTYLYGVIQVSLDSEGFMIDHNFLLMPQAPQLASWPAGGLVHPLNLKTCGFQLTVSFPYCRFSSSNSPWPAT